MSILVCIDCFLYLYLEFCFLFFFSFFFFLIYFTMTGERDGAIQVSLSWCLAGLVSLTKFWNRENEDQRCIFVLDSSVADSNPKTGGSQKVRMQIEKKKNRA